MDSSERPPDADDGSAFLLRLSAHRDFVVLFVRRARVRAQDVDDIAQETLTAAYRWRASYDPEKGDLCAWLASIAGNEVRRYYRRAHMRYEGAAGDLEPDAMPDSAPDSQARAIAGENDRLLGHLLEQIPARERDVVVAHEIDRERFVDIAAQRSIKPETARTLHRRGMEHLEAARLRWQAGQRGRGWITSPFLALLALVAWTRRAWARSMQRRRVAVLAGCIAAIAGGLLGPGACEGRPAQVAKPMIAAAALPVILRMHAVVADAGAPASTVLPPPPPSAALDLPAPSELSPRPAMVRQNSGDDEIEEKTLFYVGFAAFSAGNEADALALFERHQREFPRGKHAAERDAYLRLLHAKQRPSGHGGAQ